MTLQSMTPYSVHSEYTPCTLSGWFVCWRSYTGPGSLSRVDTSGTGRPAHLQKRTPETIKPDFSPRIIRMVRERKSLTIGANKQSHFHRVLSAVPLRYIILSTTGRRGMGGQTFNFALLAPSLKSLVEGDTLSSKPRITMCQPQLQAIVP